MGKLKWTYEKCYQEALKYTSKSEFQKRSGSAYYRARENKWLGDYTWFKPSPNLLKWTYQTCFELAKTCISIKDMSDKSQRAYQVALKNGWLINYTWFKSTQDLLCRKRPNKVKWTYDVCKKLALQYSTVGDFRRNHPLAYTASLKNGWRQEYTWLQRYGKAPIVKNDTVYAYIFTNVKSIYIGRSVEPVRRNKMHHKKDSSVFKFANNYNLPIPEMHIIEKGLTVDKGVKREDYWVKYFYNKGWLIINKAKTGENIGSMGGLGYGKWDYNKCYNEAKRYDKVADLKKGCQYVYIKATKEGWIKDFYWLYKKRASK